MPVIPRGTPFRSSAIARPLPPITPAQLERLQRVRRWVRRHRPGMQGLGAAGDFGDETGGGYVDPTTGTIPVSSAGQDWTAIFAQSIPNIFKTIQLAVTPTGGYLVSGPGGTYTISNQVPGAVPGQLNLGTSASGLGNIILFGGIAIAGIALVSALAGKK